MVSARSGVASQFVEEYGQDDEGADKEPLPVGIDAEQQKTIADDLDQRCTDDRAQSIGMSAHEVGAADHRRCDDAELAGLAQGIGD